MSVFIRCSLLQQGRQLTLRGPGKTKRPKRKLAVMNRRKWGLYGGKHVIFGNNVSHSVRRTRRKWNPNVQSKKLWSDALGRWVKLRVTTYVLRSIDKFGGLDNYLLHPKRKVCCLSLSLATLKATVTIIIIAFLCLIIIMFLCKSVFLSGS